MFEDIKNYCHTKTKILTVVTLLCYCITIITSGIYLINRENNKSVVVYATVVKVDYSIINSNENIFNVYVNYKYNRISHNKILFKQTSDGEKYSVGDKVKFRVYKNNPETSADITDIYIFALIPTVSVVITFPTGVFIYRDAKTLKRLKEHRKKHHHSSSRNR